MGYGHEDDYDDGVRPELLSSSEDSSPEADLPFSKKFLNVFVNSTSRSSSRFHLRCFTICQLNYKNFLPKKHENMKTLSALAKRLETG